METTELKDVDVDRGRPKTATIVVNGRRKTVTAKRLTFEEIVALAYDDPPTGPNVVITVTYRRGDRQRPEGTLVPGESVRVRDGMIFNVTATDKS